MHEHVVSEFTLGFSFVLGAIHALEPGHGKTALVVYMLGGRRSFWHPVVMGLSTAISHSLSLFAIAFAVHLVSHLVTGDHHHETQVAGVLQWISAALVVCVGLYLLLQATRGRQHWCCNHGHHSPEHHEGASHGACCHHVSHVSLTVEPAKAPRPSSFKTTALLGLAVGLLPCPSALAAYFAGLSSGHPMTAYLIIAVFAAGIACSLTAVGLTLQHLGDCTAARLRVASHAGAWSYVRGFLILGVGLYYSSHLLFA